MFVNVTNLNGRQDTINVRMINYTLEDKGTLFANFCSDGSSSPVTKKQVDANTLISVMLTQGYFLDLRGSDGDGFILNLSTITHADAAPRTGVIQVSFSSPRTSVQIPFALEPVLTAALLAFAENASAAQLDSPHFTGVPTAPLAAPSNNSTQLATTAFVQQEIDMQYARLIDSVGTDIMYIGEAAPGAPLANPVWRIKKVSTVGDDITVTWAGGTAAFDKIWDDRLSLSYS